MSESHCPSAVEYETEPCMGSIEIHCTLPWEHGGKHLGVIMAQFQVIKGPGRGESAEVFGEVEWEASA